MNIYKIVKVTDANDESVDKLVERNRIGKTVTAIYPFEIGMPLHLQYVGGEKDGGVIMHSRIVKVDIDDRKTSEELKYKVYTKNTMVELEYQGFLSKPGRSGAFLR